jgi:hypothetical protein
MMKLKIAAALVGLTLAGLFAPSAHADPVFGDWCSRSNPLPPPTSNDNVCTSIGQGGMGGTYCDTKNPVFTRCPWAQPQQTPTWRPPLRNGTF